MPQKRHRRGVLTRMVKYPKGSGHKPDTPLRKLLTWLGAIAGGAFLLVMVGFLVMLVLNPALGGRDDEGDFKVERIVEHPPGYLPAEHIVAAAEVVIEKLHVTIPLSAERRSEAQEGKPLHVAYTYQPITRQVTVRFWRPAGPIAPAK